MLSMSFIKCTRKALYLFIVIITELLIAKNVEAQILLQSFEEAWQFALNNNKSLESSSLELAKSMQENNIAASYYYPSVSAGISAQYNIDIAETPLPGEAVGRPGEVEFIAFGLAFAYTAGLTVNQPLVDWQLINQSKITKFYSEVKRAENLLLEQNIKEQVAQLYYSALLYQEILSIAENELLLSDSILQITKDRFNEGASSKISLNQAKINQNASLERYEQASSAFKESKISLKLILGVPQDETLTLRMVTRFDDIVDTEYINPNHRKTDVSLINYQIAELEIKQAQNNFTPKLDLVYFWGATQYQENLALSFESGDWFPNSYVGLNLSIPIFTGFGNKNRLKSSEYSAQVAYLEHTENIREESLNDSLIMNSLVSAKRLVELANESVKLSKENTSMAFSNYTEGLISLDSYLSYQNEYLATENQFLNRLAEYYRNKAVILSRE
jgi:outer membrane protein